MSNIASVDVSSYEHRYIDARETIRWTVLAIDQLLFMMSEPRRAATGSGSGFDGCNSVVCAGAGHLAMSPDVRSPPVPSLYTPAYSTSSSSL